MSNLGLGILASFLLLLSCFANALAYFAIATAEARPGERKAHYLVNAFWSLLNVGIVALLVSKCFA
ncbi:MAG: hypothetical protein AAB389_02220 [Patescibacteria group bacterium]